MGDFNIDHLKCESSNHSHDFLSSLQSCYLAPAIDKPTRVRPTSATLIDNIFVNNPDKVMACGNLITDLSDHFAQFCILKSMKAKARITGKKSKIRDFSRFSSDRLNADLSNVDWSALFANESNDINSIFSSFYNKFNKLVNKHAPMKKISNRKAKQFSKPWITKGLLKSIRVKNKLYVSGDTAKYKMYRNKICTLTRISKQQYYTKFFNDNLTNMKKKLYHKAIVCCCCPVLSSKEHPEIKANAYTFLPSEHFVVFENKNNYFYGRNATVILWLECVGMPI